MKTDDKKVNDVTRFVADSVSNVIDRETLIVLLALTEMRKRDKQAALSLYIARVNTLGKKGVINSSGKLDYFHLKANKPGLNYIKQNLPDKVFDDVRTFKQSIWHDHDQHQKALSYIAGKSEYPSIAEGRMKRFNKRSKDFMPPETIVSHQQQIEAIEASQKLTDIAEIITKLCSLYLEQVGVIKLQTQHIPKMLEKKEDDDTAAA